MLNKFKKFLSKKKLATKNDRILLTVSGGADSIAMLHLFYSAGFNIAIAHCNFKLRDQDSEKDEIFVKNIAKKYNLQLHIKRCDTKKIAEKNKISIEMAAREIRYSWFIQIAENYDFSKIATAHHLNDSVETILLNLSKKTGLNGMTGIPVINGKIIRPLLFAKKEQIIKYCNKNNLSYRKDYTNEKTEYQRNKIRHLIIPQFQKLNPAFIDNVKQTADNLKQYKKLFKIYFKKFTDKCVFYDNYSVYINKGKMLRYEPVGLFLFQFLRKFGFNPTQVKNILTALSNTGKQFLTNECRLIIDRNYLIISKINPANKKIYKIDEKIDFLTIKKNQPDELQLKIIIKNYDELNIVKKPKFAFLDYDKLKFPLILRKWQNGDFFYPFGMTNKKKLSDFFSDNKLSLNQKENTWILCSGKKIIWIVGYRIDDRFKITKNTKKAIVLEKIK